MRLLGSWARGSGRRLQVEADTSLERVDRGKVASSCPAEDKDVRFLGPVRLWEAGSSWGS